ncbi:MAG: flagellar export protein FliJ [Nitrospirota bacterium]|nr:flagellar export protein FliJ [Nitrospirota bacterium]MDE3224849.1 flagellar export protein FliJ [Nitrospirota bacterium]MDE3243053.1 flagellar export protein FliJ [Nitrospirota bacterium]
MNLTVLKNYRSRLEEGLRLELAALDQRLQTAEEALVRVQAAADDGARAYLTDAETGLTADEVAGRYDAWAALADAIRRAQAVVEEARRLRNEKMREVLEMSRDKKQVALLEAREIRRLRREEDRREQRAMDEAAAVRYRLDGRKG